MLKKISFVSILITCCVLLVGLLLLAYIGFFNRYWQDDWCYNRDFKNLGFINTLQSYFFTGQKAQTGYSTNRYSLTLLSGLLYLAGIFGTQILATLVIVLWLGGLLWVLSNLSKIYGLVMPKTIALVAITFLLYFVLYLSPQRFQILYWRSGVHYSFTIIAGLYIIGLITSQMIKTSTSKMANYLIAPLAFMAGGLSEIGCAYLVSGITLLLVAVWFGRRKKVDWASRSYSTTLITFISLLASMLALILSPSNSRSGTIPAKPTGWLFVPFLSFEFSFNFMVDSLRSLLIPHLVFIAFFLSLSILFGFLSSTKTSISFRKAGFNLLAITVVVFLLIAAVQAPNIRFYSTPADPRGQSLSRFTMLAGLAIMAWMMGQMIFNKWKKEWLIVIALIGVVLSAIYATRLIAANYAELPGYMDRAQLWDKRDGAIRAAMAEGSKMVDVLVIDTHGMEVQDIMRSRDMNGKWVTSCASDYYGLQAIRALQP
jgi:hypothetical protein